jgi:hypothetical protein
MRIEGGQQHLCIPRPALVLCANREGNTMKAWTDYPFERLGDKPNEMAPVREITVKSYDGDKYCRVKVGRVSEEVKAGYIYQQAGRLGEVPPITKAQLALLKETP